MVSPQGGPMDNKAPKIINSEPPINSTKFKGDKVLIEFNEFIQLKELNTKLLISPPFEEIPEIEARGKKLIVKLPKILKENTTYTFFMGDAIADITEQNAIKNFSFTLSTGETKDSLQLNGKVLDAAAGTAEDGLWAALYKSVSDSGIAKNRPDYISKTDKEGNFTFYNIAKGDYYLVAFKDMNSNLKYDLVTEKIAFLNEKISVDSTKESLANTYILNAFIEDKEKQYVKKEVNDVEGFYRVILNKPSDSVDVKWTKIKGAEPFVFTERTKNNDTLSFWFSKNSPDSIGFYILDGINFKDTISFKRKKNKEGTNAQNSGRGSVMGIEKTSISTGVLNINDELRITFNRPIESMHESRFLLFKMPEEDKKNKKAPKDTIKTEVPLKINKSLNNEKECLIQFERKEGAQYQLLILKAAVKEYMGFENDSLVYLFKCASEKEYGSLKLNVINKNNKSIKLNVLNKEGAIVKSQWIKENTSLNLKYLREGNYQLQLHYDKNKDGRWTPGKYWQGEQPEQILKLSDEVSVKTSFETEKEIIIDTIFK